MVVAVRREGSVCVAVDGEPPLLLGDTQIRQALSI